MTVINEGSLFHSGRGKAQVKWLANNGRCGGAFVSRSSPHTVTRISCPQAAQWKMSMWVSSRAGMACDAASRIGLPQLQAGDSILSDEAISFQPSACALEHDPEKWKPVFRKDHAPPKWGR
jgi:hypothetical protein